MVGSGGREHAISWKLLQSKRIRRLFVAPGNGGTKEFNVPISSGDITKLKDFAKENECFTIVGPEAPLAAGIVDEFRSVGLPIFGPTEAQAKMETSKAYAKDFMKEHGIPTAEYRIFENCENAIDYAALKNGNVVVKADGLAAGKGVIVCSTTEEAESAIKQILQKKVFGKAGEKIVIEERLLGREASFMFLCDGKHALNFGTAVDHKRVFDGDRGPNTGGMGAYSPASETIAKKLDIVREKIVEHTIKYSGFRGFLYIGLMFGEDDSPNVLEFNARLGDPEAQAILPRLDTDLLGLLYDCEIDGTFENSDELKWKPKSSCCVVMCSEGYPENPKTGEEIKGISDAGALPDVIVFQSGTISRGNSLFTNGGRVLSVTGLGNSPSEAASNAYGAVSLISWRGEHHRTDISSSVPK